jgi:hypothetical protein
MRARAIAGPGTLAVRAGLAGTLPYRLPSRE